MDEPAATSPAVPTTRSRRALIVLAAVAVAAAALSVALGLSRVVGAPLRGSTLVMQEQTPPDIALNYTDAPAAGAFFDARDTATVRVPWDMTVAEFLSFYHLQNNPDARRALREQLDAAEDADRLAEGAEVTFHLTARRGTRER